MSDDVLKNMNKLYLFHVNMQLSEIPESIKKHPFESDI